MSKLRLVRRLFKRVWTQTEWRKECFRERLHLRRKYDLGPIRIVWYLGRYHEIRVSDAGVNRILKHYGLNTLPPAHHTPL